MELFRTEQYYIFVSGEYSLWFDRYNGALIPKTGWDLVSAEDPECLGICHGIVGKIEHHSVFETRLMLIKECSPVGHLHGSHVVYKIKSITFLQLGPENVDLNLQKCQKHKTKDTTGAKKTSNIGLFDNIPKNAAFSKTWGTIKSAGNTIKNTTQHAAAIAKNQVQSSVKRRDSKDRGKFEKRIVDELHKIFTDTDSFYFCRTGDVTNTLQRQCDLQKANRIDQKALWKTVDDRFFWNKHMLHDLILFDTSLADPWILPIIQGFVQIEHCKVEVGYDSTGNETFEPRYETFTLSLISRRSRFRAGTRYKRRGVDDEGHCANYVETEQIVTYHHHQVSFVQVRGSVPVYWSQPGYKYRPPPRLDKGEEETQIAFEKHFNNELQMYGPVCIVNLVDQAGKERVIWDSYSNHIFKFNNPEVTYATFDFHEYCRGMHFENVSVLINAIADVIRDMNYCWRDREGQICSQTGVFRVNCIDCLDRTNVVQTALGKAVMEIQFTKLGLIPPEGIMPTTIRNTFQLLWANNGDIISKQYAGTNALKGDYTRTGERKFTGIMKDGMNSANRFYQVHFTDLYRQCCLDLMHGNYIEINEFYQMDKDHWHEFRTVGNIASELVPFRPPSYIPELAFGLEIQLANAIYHMARYYLSRFKDTYRQGTIDIMLGHSVSEEIFSDNRAVYEEDSAATAEHVKLLIEDSKKMLISNPEFILGAWGLIDADPSSGDPMETEMDAILILTKDSYYVADYDDQIDKVTKYQRVPLEELTLLEFGIPDTSVASSLFKNNSKTSQHHCIRINYKVDGVEGYYHMFRSTNLRFFNNMAVVIKNEEEMIESLKAICEAFLVALDICDLPPVPYTQGQKLDRRKSKIVGGNSIYLDITGFPHLTRNVSETQLLALKTVGSKALSNVSEQFSKLNRLGHSFNTRKTTPKVTALSAHAKFTVGKSNILSKNDSTSESDDDDCDISIFQPQSGHTSQDDANYTPVEEFMLQERTPHSQTRETNLTHSDQNQPDTFLPSVGIVMGSKANETGTETQPITMASKENMMTYENSSNVDTVCLTSIVQNVSIQQQEDGTKLTVDSDQSRSATPEITINNEAGRSNIPESVSVKMQPPNSLKLDRKLSHSSGEVDLGDAVTATGGHLNLATMEQQHRANSEQDFYLNISQSQSESALRQLRSGITTITSPVATATKDLVLSPFSKLAKGMQNLGANLDPRKMAKVTSSGVGGPTVRQITEKEYEEHRKLQEKWRNCNTRLIAL